MKLRTEKKGYRRRCRPFLVLPPVIVNESWETDQEDLLNMTNKNTGLKLFTKTWPPKRENKNNKNSEEPARPLTATLEKPTILDISLIGKIDMSKVRKEFLNISNLCRVPLILKTKKTLKINRPLSLPPTEKHKNKKKRVSDTEDSWEDDESSTTIQSARKTKNNKINNKIKKIDAVINTKKNIPVKNSIVNNSTSDANNNKTFKVPRKHAAPNSKVLNVKSELSKSTKLPEPCKTCGRPDQPERFHSHPVTPLRTAKKMDVSPKIPVKSTVQKPVAIKYKSKAITEGKPLPIRKSTVPEHQKLVHTTATAESRVTRSDSKKVQSEPRPRSAKRTLTCYLCGREFGTASLTLHEPKCLEKWERENAMLPPNLRRKPPQKPDVSCTTEDWNRLAWEASQATLAPCQHCLRTFYPDRLLVHQRSCKTPQHNGKTVSADYLLPSGLIPMSQSTPSTPSRRQPLSIQCHICGKLFSSNSIKIHEQQCLKRFNAENKRTSPPSRNDDKELKTSEGEKEKEDRPKSNKKCPYVPCYICGRQFSVSSICIHEPQCLKKWKIENDKLPPNKRRKEPVKPDIKFKRDGKVDHEATNEAIWQSHLSQLVPCKICARTFNPDRVEVHERSCKGY